MSKTFLEEFIKEVYPEKTELCMVVNSEKTCLIDATKLIRELKAELAKVKAQRDRLRMLFHTNNRDDMGKKPNLWILEREIPVIAVEIQRHAGESGFGGTLVLKEFAEKAITELEKNDG